MDNETVIPEVQADATPAMKDIDPDNDDQRKAVMAKLKEGGGGSPKTSIPAHTAKDMPESTHAEVQAKLEQTTKDLQAAYDAAKESNWDNDAFATHHAKMEAEHARLQGLERGLRPKATYIKPPRGGYGGTETANQDTIAHIPPNMRKSAMSNDLPLSAWKVGARNSADDQQRLQAIHDHAASMMQSAQAIHDHAVDNGAECNCDDEASETPEEAASQTATDEPVKAFSFNYIKSLHLSIPEEFYRDVVAVKSIGPDSIKGYMVLWGDPARVDVEGEYFTRKSNFWDDKLKMPKPLTWDHALDPATKSEPIIGTISEMGDDEIGRWYTAQLDRNHKYRKAIDTLISQHAIGTSSDSAPQYVIREPQKSGAVWLRQWPLFAAALTTTPAEPRMFNAGSVVWKSISDSIDTRMGALDRANIERAQEEIQLIKLLSEVRL